MTYTEEVYKIELVEEGYQVTLTEEEVKFIETAPVIIQVTNAANITKSLQCGEIIGGQKVVYLDEGKIYIASNDNPDCRGKVIGVTSQAGVQEEFINVVTFGEVNGFSELENEQYYLGLNGAITKVIPTTGFYQPIGNGMSANKFNVNIGNFITRG